MFIVRQSDDTHKIIIEPPVDLEEGNNEKEIITATMAKITDLIEQYIRRYPHEWAWMHRRWKSRPAAKIKTKESDHGQRSSKEHI